MSRNLRRRPRISYHEIEEPDFDEYVFCDQCGDEVYEYCAVHGPLLVLPDDKVPTPTGYPSFVPHAALTIPQEFLHLARSTIPDAGLGVFASLTLPKGVRLGPYRGQRITEPTSEYCWQIYDGSNHRRPLHVVDAGDPQRSNWMRYVNCSRFWAEQNLVAYQYQGELYYRTVKIIPRMTELLVFYGAEFARALRIDLRLYNKTAAITVLPSKNNQPSKTNATSEKREIIDQVAGNIDLPSTSNDQNWKNDEKADITQTKHKNYNKKEETTKKCDLTLEITKSRHLENNELQAHILKDTSSIKSTAMDYSCTICMFQTNQEKRLKSHLKAHSAAKQFRCDSCLYIAQSKLNLIQHMRTHTGEKSYVCQICSKKFSQSGHLIRHIRTHTGEKPHVCQICSKKFSHRGHLISHIRTHTGEKPYVCQICSKKFSHRGDLIRHIRTHTGEKPYVCQICSKKFIKRGDLIRHIRTHTGEKPYVCQICSKKFIKRGDLIRHTRTHTGEKPHVCQICSKKFIQSGDLKRHTRTHTGEKPHVCQICNMKFIDKRCLDKHILRLHSGDKL